MTAEQLALDDDSLWSDWDQLCTRTTNAPADPTWTDHQPATPTPADLRDHELADLQRQHAGPYALRTAHTIPTGRYL